MISNLELYGTNYVPTVPKEVADARLALLKNRLEEVMSVKPHWDSNLVGKILKAQDFWRKLRDGESI